MAILINYNIVRFEISEDDVSPMKIFKSKQHFAQVLPCTFLSQPTLLVEDMAKITSWAEFQDQEELGLCLESVVEANDEGMLCVRKHISLSFGVSYQIVAEDLVLCQDFHGEKLSCFDLSHQVDLTKGTFAEAHEGHEVIWTNSPCL